MNILNRNHLARHVTASPSKPKSAAAVARSPIRARHTPVASSSSNKTVRELLTFDEIREHTFFTSLYLILMLSSAPIYDGRGGNGSPAFDFSADNFTRLESLPMYVNEAGERDDVPVGAVVAVGYSIGTYIGSKGRSLSPNLLFLIVLALPIV
jgi:hypothetical protein